MEAQSVSFSKKKKEGKERITYLYYIILFLKFKIFSNIRLFS
jgi:hypothetical protein